MLQTSHNASVCTFLRSDDEGLADGVEQATVSIDEVGHVLGGGERRRADCERLREANTLTMSLYQPQQPHDEVKIQHRPAALTTHTKDTPTMVKKQPQIILDMPINNQTHPPNYLRHIHK